METAELLEVVSRGEDSKHQLKVNFTNVNSLASELVALSDSGGRIGFIENDTMKIIEVLV